MSSGRLLASLLISFILLFGPAANALSALSVTPSTTWYGDDGSWSAVSIRVGSPQQWVDLLVSTASSETWVVSPGGCDGSSTCTSKRGGLFDFNKSSTWQTEGVFELGLDTQLGFGGDADYGLDTLEFGTTGVALKDTIIGSLNTTEYLLGFFGLGNIPGNFTNAEVSSPVNALENQSIIPSNAYGYTAGAIYQGKSVPCSLTLGGYDANRFVPHNISFELNPVHQPEAWLNSVSVASSSSNGRPPNWASNTLQLLAPSDGVYVTIDSSTPFLWLPKSACESFAKALGLTYNDTLALYTFDGNASRHDDLKNWGLNFTFSLSDTSNPSQIVNITLPYAAFDLQLSYPYVPNTTYETGNKYYFPLRQAANNTQYILGRSFLQEAYIIADYERNNFSVHQAVHPANPLGNASIIDILKPGTSVSQSPPQVSSSPLGTPIIVGIAIGSAAVILLIVLIIFLVRRHRSRQNASHHQHAITLGAKSDPEQTPPPTSTGLSSIFPQNTSPIPKPSSLSTALNSPSSAPISAVTPHAHAHEADSTPITPHNPPHTPTAASTHSPHERFELPAPYSWPEELDGQSIHSFKRGERGERGEAGEKFAGGMGWEGENVKFRASMKMHKSGEEGRNRGREKGEGLGSGVDEEEEGVFEEIATRGGGGRGRGRGRTRFSWETGDLAGGTTRQSLM